MANGVKLPIPLDVARDVAEILAATGRAPDPRGWMDLFIERGKEVMEATMPHNVL